MTTSLHCYAVTDEDGRQHTLRAVSEAAAIHAWELLVEHGRVEGLAYIEAATQWQERMLTEVHAFWDLPADVAAIAEGRA